MGLPTLIFFRDGAEAERYTGLLEYDELRRKVEQLLATQPAPLTIQPLSAIHSHFISSSSEQSAMRNVEVVLSDSRPRTRDRQPSVAAARQRLVFPIAAGILTICRLGSVKTKIEDIMREEMDAIDGQEVTLPVVHPADT